MISALGLHEKMDTVAIWMILFRHSGESRNPESLDAGFHRHDGSQVSPLFRHFATVSKNV